MAKDPGAYRTIGEVSDVLAVPQHVLRFWEGQFPQIDPLKRGGGRRYYRPEQVAVIETIRDLLYRDGYTIKGVQRLLKSKGAGVGKLKSGDAGLDEPPAECGASPRFLPSELDALAAELEDCQQALSALRASVTRG